MTFTARAIEICDTGDQRPLITNYELTDLSRAVIASADVILAPADDEDHFDNGILPLSILNGRPPLYFYVVSDRVVRIDVNTDGDGANSRTLVPSLPYVFRNSGMSTFTWDGIDVTTLFLHNLDADNPARFQLECVRNVSES